MNPIYIPTKGRAFNATTPKLLADEGIPFTLVVEPQEVETYRSEYPDPQKIMVLSESNRGIGFARQQILERAFLMGEIYYWQIDDDLIGFFDGSGSPVSIATALDAVETPANSNPKIALAGFRWPEWKHNKPFELNTCIYQAVLTRTDTGINYATDGMRQDSDFIIQHLVKGWLSLRLNIIAAKFPEMGKTTGGGGLTDDYKNGKTKEAAEWLHKRWPFCTKMRKYKGRKEAFVDWKVFQ